MEKNRKKEGLIFVISVTLFILMIAFIVSMVVSMIGGSWETMVQSSVIMTVWTADLITSIITFTVLIISILMYNIE